MTNSSGVDDRSPTAKAMSKVSEILAVCLLPIIPSLIGVWLDRRLGTVFLMTVFGLAFGLLSAFVQLKKLVSQNSSKEEFGAGRDKSGKSD